MQGSQPHEDQLQLLLKMLRCALLEIRLHGRRGQARQAADLADAFHNLPTLLLQKEWSIPRFHQDLLAYQQTYYSQLPPLYDYMAMLAKAEASPKQTEV